MPTVLRHVPVMHPKNAVRMQFWPAANTAHCGSGIRSLTGIQPPLLLASLISSPFFPRQTTTNAPTTKPQWE